MQIIFENEDGRSNNIGIGILDIITCTRRISRHMERECNGGIGGRGN